MKQLKYFGAMALLCGLAACTSRVDVPTSTPPNFSGTEGTVGSLGSGGGLAGTGGVLSGTLPGTSISDRVLFAVDKTSLDDSGRAILDAQIGWLKANPQAAIVIEGHADERGTGEYNLALGSGRASSVRNYMVTQGIPDTRISIITYGRERPVATCADDSCWRLNRRAVTVVSGAVGS